MAQQCSVGKCEKQAACRGWCPMHYQRWRLHGDVNHVPEPRPAYCTVANCDRRVEGHGYCSKHYQVWKRHGDPLAVKSRNMNGPKPCSIDGCSSPAQSRGWCTLHYASWRSWGDPEASRRSTAERLPLVCAVEGCEAGASKRHRKCRTHLAEQRSGAPTTTDGRFWAKVDQDAPVPDYAPHLGNCWWWTAAMNHKGYGVFGMYSAHRWSYAQTYGRIPDGLEIDHLCRVRCCVRPDHLEAVTTAVNCYRGESFAAVNAIKTHCPHGHPYTPENTYGVRGRSRQCRTCTIYRARGESPDGPLIDSPRRRKRTA